jgi:hypothetical protein
MISHTSTSDVYYSAGLPPSLLNSRPQSGPSPCDDLSIFMRPSGITRLPSLSKPNEHLFITQMSAFKLKADSLSHMNYPIDTLFSIISFDPDRPLRIKIKKFTKEINDYIDSLIPSYHPEISIGEHSLDSNSYDITISSYNDLTLEFQSRIKSFIFDTALRNDLSIISINIYMSIND